MVRIWGGGGGGGWGGVLLSLLRTVSIRGNIPTHDASITRIYTES